MRVRNGLRWREGLRGNGVCKQNGPPDSNDWTCRRGQILSVSDSSVVSYTNMKVRECMSDCLYRKKSYLTFINGGSLSADRRLGRQGEVLHQELGPRQQRLRPLRLQRHAVDPDFAGGSLVLSVHVNGADVGHRRDEGREPV